MSAQSATPVCQLRQGSLLASAMYYRTVPSKYDYVRR